MLIINYSSVSHGIIYPYDYIRNSLQLFGSHLQYLTAEIGIQGAIQHLAVTNLPEVIVSEGVPDTLT